MARSLSSIVAVLCLTLGGAFGPFAQCNACYENRCQNECMEPSGANCPAVPNPAFENPPPFYKIDETGTLACYPADVEGQLEACGVCFPVGDQGFLFEQFSFPNPWQTCVVDPFSFADPDRPQQYWRFDADPVTKVVHYTYSTAWKSNIRRPTPSTRCRSHTGTGRTRTARPRT